LARAEKIKEFLNAAKQPTPAPVEAGGAKTADDKKKK
jgi:hypothetical protein